VNLWPSVTSWVRTYVVSCAENVTYPFCALGNSVTLVPATNVIVPIGESADSESSPILRTENAFWFGYAAVHCAI
jgi:hypothetical protein